MIKEIEAILNQEITLKQQQLTKIKQQLVGNLTELLTKIKIIIENPNKLISLNLNDLKENIEISLETFSKLQMYQLFLNTKNFSLEEYQFEDLKEMLLTFDKYFQEKTEIILKENPKYSQDLEQIEILNQLKKNLLTNKITITDFNQIVDLIKNSSNSNKIALIADLSFKVINNYDKTNLNQNEEITIEVSNLSILELTDLFLKYNYNIEDFANSKDILLKYGNLANIESILKLLNENQITINISEVKQKFATILTLSNAKVILRILDNIKNDLLLSSNIDYNLNEAFINYLNYPSIFIPGTMYHTNKQSDNSTNNNFEGISGAYHNYILNREYFKELGLKDINNAIFKCGSAFTLSHQRVRNSVAAFDLYGIDKSIYLDTLTCMSAKNPLLEIDKYIELGCYEYVASNFSMVAFPQKNKEIYYQIKNARNQGYTNDNIYRFIRNGNQKKVVLRKKSFLDKMNGKNLDNELEYHSDLENEYASLDFSTFLPINDNILTNSFIKKLEDNYKSSDLTYDFNGIIISRYKVLRIYTVLLQHNLANNMNSLMYAITKGSLLTKAEYDMIGECLNLSDTKGRNI